MPAERNELLDRAFKSLTRNLGQMQVKLADDRCVAIVLPGLDPFIFVFPRLTERPLYTLGLCIAEGLDWESTQGLAQFALRENADMFFGRLQIAEDSSLQLEHHVFADSVTGKELAVIVLNLADAAIRIRSDLRTMWTLPLTVAK